MNYDIRFMNYKQYLEINSEKRFGKPIIKGTRISVADVLNWLANGMSVKEITEDFHELNEQHRSKLAYSLLLLNKPISL